MNEESSQWPKDLENLKSIPSTPNKYKKVLKEKKITGDDLIVLEKRLNKIEKYLDNLNAVLNVRTIHEMKRRMIRLEGDVHDGNNSRPQTNSK